MNRGLNFLTELKETFYGRFKARSYGDSIARSTTLAIKSASFFLEILVNLLFYFSGIGAGVKGLGGVCRTIAKYF